MTNCREKAIFAASLSGRQAMKQLIVINTETANKCQVGSGGSLRAPPCFGAPSPLPHSSSFWGILGGGHHCGKSSTSFRLAYCDKEEALLPDLSSRLLRCLYVSCEWRGETDPSAPAIVIRAHSCFNFSSCKWQVTRPSPSSYGPCGVVIAFLDDFLFKSAVLLIFQMK